MNNSKILTILATASIALSLGGCDYAKNQLAADREGNMEVQDYKDALAPRLPEVDEDENKKANDYASIPELQAYVGGVDGVQTSMPLVSISVNQTVPLRDMLYELAQQAEYDIELDPRITGSIIFSARNKPLDEVIDRISDMAGLRYSFEDETLRVELDTPTNKVYKVDYLSLVRSNSSSISNDVSVVSGDGADTGSSFESSFENEIDFWAELETNIAQILAATNSRMLKTSSDPEITAAPQQPTVVPVAAPDASGKVEVSPPDVNLNIGSLPTSSGEAYEFPPPTYAINKQAGIIQVFATQRTQDKIDQYLKLVKKSVTAQVLIEAKILEVALIDEYAAGIEWGTAIAGGETLLGLSRSGTAPAGTPLFNPDGTVDTIIGASINAGSVPYFGFLGDDLSVAAHALSEFGTVKALASPRLTVLNNQTAALNVTTNKVFFDIDVETVTDGSGGPGTQTIDSELKNVPIGILVNVQPSINLENGTISMALRPTITSENGGGIQDPAASNLGVVSLIPEISVREIDTIVQANSGQTIILGGLLQDRVSTDSEGVPGLSEVPLLGNLFRQNDDSINKSEIVILLKATILENPEDSIHNTDKDLYRKFSNDRRPFKL